MVVLVPVPPVLLVVTVVPVLVLLASTGGSQFGVVMYRLAFLISISTVLEKICCIFNRFFGTQITFH
jgi:hypothetical protein